MDTMVAPLVEGPVARQAQAAVLVSGGHELEGGKIVEQVVGDNAFHTPYQELVLWKMDFPTETPDPRPAILAAGGPK
jgi:hypothetical protein